MFKGGFEKAVVALLDNGAKVQGPAVAKYVDRLRRAHPEESPAQIDVLRDRGPLHLRPVVQQRHHGLLEPALEHRQTPLSVLNCAASGVAGFAAP
ncbi:hypothetical protein [Nocardia terpenica]|uniref:Uncharacterized protein n=1 Tax=Nocardia terpenica TaxID=455432 RepID=A0A164KJY3_9NOCA|nr:hypothetical protein [Nocardia terpenica]KZM71470.1 hypothetical protein AWN90_01560 [Nocardia terpenica]